MMNNFSIHVTADQPSDVPDGWYFERTPSAASASIQASPSDRGRPQRDLGWSTADLGIGMTFALALAVISRFQL